MKTRKRVHNRRMLSSALVLTILTGVLCSSLLTVSAAAVSISDDTTDAHAAFYDNGYEATVKCNEINYAYLDNLTDLYGTPVDINGIYAATKLQRVIDGKNATGTQGDSNTAGDGYRYYAPAGATPAAFHVNNTYFHALVTDGWIFTNPFPNEAKPVVDGATATNSSTYSSIFTGTDGALGYFRFDLAAETEIDAILNSGSVSLELNINEYQLYVSNDPAELFNAENRVAGYERTGTTRINKQITQANATEAYKITDGVCEVVPKGTPDSGTNSPNYNDGNGLVQYPETQVFEFTGTKKPVGRYVGMKIIKAGGGSFTNRVDISEFAVYGQEYVDTSIAVSLEYNSGGTVTGPARVEPGEDAAYAITPDDGYYIFDVLADGVSVGKVENYTFENVQEPHTLKVIFAKTAVSYTHIDFEEQYTLEQGPDAPAPANRRMEIIDGTGYNNQQTGLLHVKGGSYGSATFLNWHTTAAQYTDPVFVVPVKPNTLYKWSIRYKLESPWTVNTGDLYIYVDYSSSPRKYIAIPYSNAQKDVWLTAEMTFGTGPDQHFISTTFNAGNNHGDLWFDDIELTEIGSAVLNTTPQDYIHIDFEKPYPLQQSDRMSIEDGVGFGGTSGLFVPSGSYPSATFLNWSTVTTNTDLTFTLPVKPNTQYKWSIRVKVSSTSKNNTSYLAIYADYLNSRFIRFDVLEKEKDEWHQLEMSFITGTDQNFIGTCFNAGDVHGDIWFDDIELREIMPGVIEKTDLSYCEDFYNLLGQSFIENKIKDNKNIIYKMELEPSTRYTFAATLSYVKTSDSYLALSFLPDGTPMNESMGSGLTGALKMSSVGQEERMAYQFLTDNTGVVYFVLNNTDLALKFSDISLFRTYSLVTFSDMGYAENPNLTDEKNSVLPKDELPEGEVEEETDVNQPDTGDKGNMLIWAILILTVSATMTIVLKRKNIAGGGK